MTGKTKARAVAKQETREALIQAGIELFGEAGLEQPSLDAICAHAGFTRGAFYVHFKDRTDFQLAVVDQALKGFVDSVIADRGQGDLAATIGRFLDAAAEERLPGVGPDRGLSLLIQALRQVPAARAHYQALMEGTLARLGEIAARDQKDGEVRGDVPARQVALIVLASAIGVSTLLDAGVRVDIDALRQAASVVIRP